MMKKATYVESLEVKKLIKVYIQFIGTVILRNLLKCFHVFPLKKNRVLFYSFNGKQYSCNPKRITEELLNKNSDIEIIWAFKEPRKFENKLDRKIKKVKFRSLSYYYYAKTSRVIVQNVQGFGELSRRKGQDVIQTWHASNGYKQQGKCSGINRKLEILYHKDYSYVLSGSNSMTERRVRGTMGFNGPVIQGTPRMDSIINQDDNSIRDRVYEYFGLDKNTKILLYAPTWRKDRNDNNYGMDYEKVYDVIKKRFGGNWAILIRLHPNVYVPPKLEYPFIYNATAYPDMQDLLYTVDILISDYSSCIWDYSFTYRPCFLYCNDIQKYGKDRDFDIPINKWRFPVCKNMNELVMAIENYDRDSFKKQMELHHCEMGNLEDGNATERACNLIVGLCGDKL